MGEKKISVIMGVYNPENSLHLFYAVKSIQEQSFKDWELILYDDGSKEEYARFIREAAALDERIVYFRCRENHGLAFALNACICLSHGKYIARMDDDDLSRKDRLEKQYDFLEAYPQYHWVGSSARLMDGRQFWGKRKMPLIPGKKDFLHYSPYIHPSVMFRRNVLISCGGYSTLKKNRQCEDYELFIRLYEKGFRGYNLQEPLLAYREDKYSYERRTYSRRIREMRLRMEGFKKLDILDLEGFFYSLKPLGAGLVPGPVQHFIRRRRKKDNDELI